jgi:hypothetical protein
MQGTSPLFPCVLGGRGRNDRGRRYAVTSRAVGEGVFAVSLLNPTGGFYAEFVGVAAISSRQFWPA